MSGRLKVLVLTFVSTPLAPDESLDAALETAEWSSEADVLRALRALGHDASVAALCDDIDVVRREIEARRPDIIFNLVDEFRRQSVNDYQVAAYFEALGVAYTGCGPRGLLLAKDKALAKMVLRHHRVRVPDSVTCLPGRKPVRPGRLGFPLIVKTLYEEGSVGIAQASIVRSDEEFRERVEFIHRTFRQPALAEAFVEGRELTCALLGNGRHRLFPIRELRFDAAPDDAPRIASYRAKWDDGYRKRWGISTAFADDLPPEVTRRIQRQTRRAARALMIDGYARFDFRLAPDHRPVLLEANPNPFLARKEDFALAAEAVRLPFEKLVEKIIQLGLERAGL